jgi:hypothetical protein
MGRFNKLTDKIHLKEYRAFVNPLTSNRSTWIILFNLGFLFGVRSQPQDTEKLANVPFHHPH